MSLEDTLNNIQENVINIEHIEIQGVQVISLETSAQILSDNKVTIDQKVIDKFNNLCHLSFLKRTVTNSNKVDKNLALEVFTMLPESNQLETAKLTTHPSVINKEVVNNLLINVSDSIPEDMLSLLSDVSKGIDEVLIEKDQTEGICSGYLGLMEGSLNRLKTNPYIIIEAAFNKSYNLLTTPISELMFAEALDCDKYNTEIRNRLKDIYDTDNLTMSMYSLDTDVNSITLETLVNGIITEIKSLDNTYKSLDLYNTSIKMIVSNSDEEIQIKVEDIVSDIDIIVNRITFLNNVKKYIEIDTGLYSKVVLLLNKLD